VVVPCPVKVARLVLTAGQGISKDKDVFSLN